MPALRGVVHASAAGNGGSNERHFDYLVIGGGSGGIASARRAASYGAKVGVIEAKRLGGTCVNVGCVPKKVMFNAAHVSEVLRSAKHFGFDLDGGKIPLDWTSLKHARDDYVKRLNGIYAKNLDNSKVTRIEGKASFSGKKALAVNHEQYTADHILIAVGGEPRFPPVPGVEHCISSDGFFDLEKQPKRVCVVGAGYIAIELCGVFHELGSETTLVIRGESILRGFDELLQETLIAEMRRSGYGFQFKSGLKGVHKDEKSGELYVDLDTGKTVGPYDCVLLATGRGPVVGPLNLDTAGVKLNEKGYVEVDEYQQTNAEGIYALGDVAGRVQLTPMAINAGRRLADRLFGERPNAKADYENVPTVVFSHPTIGTVGITERQAKEKFGEDNVKVYTSKFVNLFYGPWRLESDEKPKTAMKLICTGPDERVVGLHVIGLGADEMLQGFAVAMRMGATKADLDNCVALHPTAAEEFVTLAPWGCSPADKYAKKQKIDTKATLPGKEAVTS